MGWEYRLCGLKSYSFLRISFSCLFFIVISRSNGCEHIHRLGAGGEGAWLDGGGRVVRVEEMVQDTSSLSSPSLVYAVFLFAFDCSFGFFWCWQQLIAQVYEYIPYK
jgi:hypothetical protein